MKRTPRSNTYGSLSAIAAILFAVIGLASCGCQEGPAVAQSSSGETEAAAPRVETVEVVKEDLHRKVRMPGTVVGDETAELYSKVGGYLKEIHVDIGDKVEKDQELGRLWIPEMKQQIEQKKALVVQAQADKTQAEAALTQAEAAVISAEATLQQVRAEQAEKQAQVRFREVEHRRYQELVRNQSARRELLDQAQFQLEAANAALSTVRARVVTAQADLKSAEAAVTKAHADVSAADARVQVALADQKYVETMLEYATFRAPFAGDVIRRHADPGAYIQPAEGNSAAKPILTIARSDIVRIRFDVPMSDVAALDKEDRVRFDKIAALPGKSFEWTVTRFSPSLNMESRMMQVEVELPNKEGILRPGYYGYVTTYLEEFPDTPVIPATALQTEGEEEFVFVVIDGNAIKTPVKPNYQDGIVVGIASGLEGGEQVIRTGAGQVKDGQKVNASPAKD